MTLLLPAADRVVREAVDAVLEGRSRPGSGSDVSFATRSSRYRVIHGVLREASDASLIGSRFVGWLFDGGREPTLSERWDTDARAVLIDETKGQIVVTSLTRVHVANALAASAVPTEDGRGSPAIGGDGSPSRAGTLHGLPVVDPEPSQEKPIVVEAAPEVARTAHAAPPPERGARVVVTPTPPQATSPMPKRTIPPAPPIPGRQATPIPIDRHATPLVPMGRMGTPMMPMRPHTPPHPGTRTQPMAAMPPPKSGPGGPPPPPPSRAPSTHLGLGSFPVRPASTHLGLAPATRFPPAGPQQPIVLSEPLMTPSGPVDLASLEEVSALLSVTGEVSAAIAPPFAVEQAEAAALASADAPAPTGASAEADEAAMPAPATGPGWAGKSAPLPQFDLDDADLDLPTRTDPLPPAPPSEEEAVIPLIPRP